jgi:glycosyltransferase involved in cell wall biosynthesis
VDLEIIIINDGSTDASFNILSSISIKYKTVKIFNIPHKGVSFCRNIGIKEATGDYILFVDSDDILEINALKQLINIVKETKVDSVLFNALVFLDWEPSQTFLFMHSWQIPRLDGVFMASDFNYLPFFTNIWLCLFSRTIIINNKILFDEKISYGEDWKFMIEYLTSCKTLYFTSRCFYKYRARKNNNLSSSINNCALGVFNAFTDSINVFKKQNLWSKFEYNHYLRILFHFLWFYKTKLGLLSFENKIKQKYLTAMYNILKNIPLSYLYSLTSHMDKYDKYFIWLLYKGNYKKVELIVKFYILLNILNGDKYFINSKKAIQFFLFPVFLFFRWVKQLFVFFNMPIKIILKIISKMAKYLEVS